MVGLVPRATREALRVANLLRRPYDSFRLAGFLRRRIL